MPISSEIKTVGVLSSVLAMRLIGLFMILPVLSLYGNDLVGSTPVLMGIALGIYGLTQALFQIPMGSASDRWGRKRLIVIGLVIFALGSIIAAESTSIYGVIFGRALQGAGTIAAAVLAYIGDIVHENQRPKSMAIVGVAIGSSFMLALVLGPVLDSWIGLRGLFWIASLMAILGLLAILFATPSTKLESHIEFSKHSLLENLNVIFRSKKLVVIFLGTFVIHAAMTSLFVVFPIELVEVTTLTRDNSWKVFVPVVIISLIAIFPVVRSTSKLDSCNKILWLAFLVLVMAHISMYTGAKFDSSYQLIFGLLLFFIGFNALEITLPSLAIGTAYESMRGLVMGAFNTCTFVGTFVGGVVAGIVYGKSGASSVFMLAGIVILLALASAFGIQEQKN